MAATAVPREPVLNVPDSEGGSGLSIPQILSILWAYRVHAAIIAAAIVITTAVFTKLLPKTYTATATLMVSYEASDPLGGGQAPAVPVFNYMATEMQLMQSAEVLIPVIDRLKLADNKDYTAGYRGQGYSLNDWIKERLVKDLDIEPGRAGSQLIYVTASARYPGLAADIANTLVEIYLDQERQRQRGPASDRAKRYAQELNELKNKVNIAQDQVTAFRQRSGVTDAAARNTNGEAELLATLETRLQEAQNARRAAEVKAASDQKVGAGQAASATIQSLKTQINSERAQLAQLRATLGTAHPKVIELQNQIDANQRILDAEFNNFSAGSASDLTSARQLEAKLQAAVQEQRSKVLASSRVQDEGTKYVLELESAQSVYKRALDGYDQIMFSSDSHASSITSVSQAVPSQTAAKPNKMKLVMMGLFAGIGIGLLAPLLYELFVHRRIRCRDDFERSFAIPVLMEFDRIPAARSAA